MDKLITVKAVKERYDCSLPTARKYIRQCNPHMENPLVAPEWAFREWEESRMVVSGNRQVRTRIKDRVTTGRVIVPRRRD